MTQLHADQVSHDPPSQVEELLEENRRLKQQMEELEQAVLEYKEKERAYNQSREIYSLAIEATDLGIYDTRVRDEDLHLKENWMVRLGYDPKSAAEDAQNWESFIHPDDYERVTRQFQRAVDGEIDSYIMEYRLKAKDGTWRWIIESSKVIEKYTDGSLPRIVGTHFDITRQKNAQEAEREQRAFAEALSDTAALLNSTLEMGKVLDLILENAGRVVPHIGSDLWLADNDQDTVHLAQRKRPGKALPLPGGSIPLDSIAVFKEMKCTRKAVILHISGEEFDWVRLPGCQVKSAIITPITFGQKLLGFLVLVSSRAQSFTSVHTRRLQAFTNQAASAIRNAQLYTRAQEVAALEERQRLAREMHDVISQTLFSATIKAEALPYLFDMDQADLVRQNLVELHRLTRGALAEMRTMLMELRPNTIIHTDMANLLQQLADGLAGRTTIDVHLTTVGRGLLPPEVQTAFFRITQEAINNMIKHSRACRVDINFNNGRDKVELDICDNGCGFNPQELPPQSMGVRIMQERADAIGAALTIHSQAGEGTRLHMSWRKSETKR